MHLKTFKHVHALHGCVGTREFINVDKLHIVKKWACGDLYIVVISSFSYILGPEDCP